MGSPEFLPGCSRRSSRVPIPGSGGSATIDRLHGLKEIVIPNDLTAAKRPEELILKDVVECGYCENAAFAIKLALEEAMTNAFRHGNKYDPSKSIVIRYEVTKDQARIEVIDEGEGFNEKDVPDPTQDGYIARPHGRGIMLMRSYLDEVVFNEKGNAVCLVKLNRPIVIDVDRREGVAIVRLAGSCTMNVASQLVDCLATLASESVPLIILEMSALDFIESTGLGAIVAAYLSCRRYGGEVRLVSPESSILKLLEITRLTQLFRVFESVEDAIDSAASGS